MLSVITLWVLRQFGHTSFFRIYGHQRIGREDTRLVPRTTNKTAYITVIFESCADWSALRQRAFINPAFSYQTL
jgi:hypothetical protein